MGKRKTRTMSPQLLDVLQRGAAAGDHNFKVLLRLAQTKGIRQGNLPPLVVPK